MKTLVKLWTSLIGIYFSIQSVSAESSGVDDDGSGTPPPAPPSPPPTTNPLDSDSIQIQNPLKVGSIEGLINSMGNYLVGISAAVLTVMVLWGAFQFMTSGGNEERVSKGKKTIYWAILGFIVLLVASGLASVVADILGGANVDTSVDVDGVAINGFRGVNNIIIIIARWMFGILVGMGIIMSLYSAFLYMFSGGATEKIDAARKTLTYAIVALAIGVFSGGLGVLIQNLLNNAATTSNVETVGGGAGGTTPTANPSNSPVPTGSTPTTPTTPPTNSGSGSAFSDFFDDFDFSGDF